MIDRTASRVPARRRPLMSCAAVGLLLLTGAPLPAMAQETALQTAAIDAATARINAWFDREYQEELAFSPIARGYQGDKTDYDNIDDFSEEAADRQLEWQRRSVEEMAGKELGRGL